MGLLVVVGRCRTNTDRVGRMPNRLASETSPYLLQHADNPVDWYAWGDEAFASQRREDRPILLSVGYAACHWCHVMAHESFEDEATAALMNERFVNIKVDREERPDVDADLHAGRAGDDRTRRLADDRVPDARRRPVLRRHLLPARARHGLPSFRQVLERVSDLWMNRLRQISSRRVSASSSPSQRRRLRAHGSRSRAGCCAARRSRPSATRTRSTAASAGPPSSRRHPSYQDPAACRTLFGPAWKMAPS